MTEVLYSIYLDGKQKKGIETQLIMTILVNGSYTPVLFILFGFPFFLLVS